jgi:hypothetical protein
MHPPAYSQNSNWLQPSPNQNFNKEYKLLKNRFATRCSDFLLLLKCGTHPCGLHVLSTTARGPCGQPMLSAITRRSLQLTPAQWLPHEATGNYFLPLPRGRQLAASPATAPRPSTGGYSCNCPAVVARGCFMRLWLLPTSSPSMQLLSAFSPNTCGCPLQLLPATPSSSSLRGCTDALQSIRLLQKKNSPFLIFFLCNLHIKTNFHWGVFFPILPWRNYGSVHMASLSKYRP